MRRSVQADSVVFDGAEPRVRTAIGWARFLVFFCSCLLAQRTLGQSASQFQYYYNDAGELIKAIDASGNEIDYTYDANGNLINVNRIEAAGSGVLAILNFTPQSGAIGSSVTIQGQNFGSTPAANLVTFNGTQATVTSASASSLAVTVPAGATTGPIAVTVNGKTATSSTNFTVVSVPAILAVSPKYLVSSSAPITVSSYQVTGANLTGATFSFAPAFTPPQIVVNSAIINSGGTSATLNITVAAKTLGSFTLIATNAAGSSSPIAASGNTLQVIDPDGDADGDGLTNALEIAIGTDPLNPDTSGDGLPDGWQVFYGLNPLDPTVGGMDLDNSGLTVLQDFQQGLSPVNPNRVPPAVSQVTPANSATGIFVNDVVVVRFAEPLLTGTSLNAAQNAVAAALGTSTALSAGSVQTAAQMLQAYMNRTCCGNSVVAGTVSVFGPNGAIAGGVTPSADSLSVTFSPAQPLASNTSYTVTANGVRDSAGNLMTKGFSSTFATGASLDSTPPSVTLVDPENNSSNVPTNVHYVAQFSKAMDPSTLTPANFVIFDNLANANIAGIVQVDPSNTTASFVPNQPLPIGRAFSVSLSAGIKDNAGNSLTAAGPYHFTTGYANETVPPHFTSSSPGNGQTGIPVNALIDLEFSEPLDIATVVPNISVTLGGDPVPVLMALSSGDQHVTITPASGLQANATYSVSIGTGIADLAGLTIDNPGSFSFQTAAVVDKTQLKVLSVSPVNGSGSVPLNALVEVGFNKAADAVSVGSGNVEVYAYDPGTGAQQVLPGGVSIDATGERVTFTPSSPLAAETEYCVYINGVVDLEGQALAQDGQNLSCFTTGVSTASGALTVTGVSPGNGETGAPVNATVELSLSAAASAVSVTQGAITVSAGGTPVAGTVTQPSAATLLFTPSGSLAVSTAYTVKAVGFTDLAGNAVTAFTSTFTTGASPALDKGPLQVLSIAPANGSASVPVASSVTVTFNEAVNPLTVTTGSVNVQANGGSLAGSYNVSGATVTFTPSAPLPGSSTVSVCVDCYASVEDLAGNNGGGGSASFTTASTADTTAPRVLTVTPVNGAVGIGLNGQVTIVFSKSMNASGLGSNWSNSQISLLAGGQRQSFNVSVSADQTTATLYSLNLPSSSVITLSVPHTVEDLSGNGLASDFASQFTTGAGCDSTHAAVVNQRPSNGATGVGVGASPVVLYWNKALNAATLPSAFHVSQNGELVSGTVTVADGGQTVEFTPSGAWSNGALVQLFVDTTAEDAGGNAVTAYTGSFTVAPAPATTAPSVLNVSPGNGAKGVPLNVIVQAGYSQPIAPSSVIAAAVYLNGPSGTVASTLSLDATGTVVELKPSSPLAASSQYCFYAYGSQSVTGGLEGANGLSAQNLGYCFSTGAAAVTTGPTVVTVSPADKLQQVPVNANIGLVFSSPIDPLTVNGITVSVTGGSQTAMPASIAFTNLNQTVQITPQAPLPASTAMTITVNGVTDVAGNPVTGFSSGFTTGSSPATASAGMVAANPPAGSTGVPVNAALALTASAELDAVTVNAGTFQVWDTVLNQQAAGSYGLSSDGLTAYFVPASQLATGRTYMVYFSSYGMTDLAGNAITGCCGYLNNYSFTTGFSASGTGPAVTGVSPGNGLTGVPLNARIVAAFNEPVDAGSLSGITLTAGAAQVAVTASLSNANQLLTVTPTQGLAPSTLYTLTIAGVTDLAANPIAAPFSSSFTTSGVPDLTQLKVLSVSPVNGSGSVPLNALVEVGFNKAADAVSVGSGNVEVYAYDPGTGAQQVLPGGVSIDATGERVTFTPSTPLAAETEYCVYINGVVDLEGQALAQDGQNLSCFTTGVSTASGALTVTGVSPGNGETGAPVNATVELSLSAAASAVSVTQGAITVSAGGTPVAGTVTQPSAATLLFTPSGSLAVSTAYTVKAVGFTDLAGNAVTAFTSTFTTGASPALDKGPLQVLSIAPANGSASVPVASSVTVTFNEAVNPLTVTTGSVNVQANGGSLAGSYNVSGATVTFTPSAPLPGSSTVSVCVDCYASVEDLAGNNGGGGSASFTTASTADTTAPRVLTVTPVNGAAGIGLNGQVTIVFSKSMNASGLGSNWSNSQISLLAGGQRQSFNVSVSADQTTATLYSLNLPSSSVITLSVPHTVEDLSGNGLASDFASQFTTGAGFDSTHAAVVNQRPANGATGVGVGASPVVLYWNKALNAATLPSAFHVSQNGELVSGTVTVADGGQTVEFTPSGAWSNGA